MTYGLRNIQNTQSNKQSKGRKQNNKFVCLTKNRKKKRKKKKRMKKSLQEMKKMKLKNKKNQQQGHEKRTGKKLQKRVQLKCYLFSCKTFIDTFIKWKNPLFSHHFTFATITHAGTPATTLAYNMYVYIRLMFFLSFFPSFIL